jgi:ATP-dependent Lon protease
MDGLDEALPVPILRIRDSVLFPSSFMRISVGRDSSLCLVQESIWKSFHQSLENTPLVPVLVGIFTEFKTPSKEDYSMGTIGTISRVVQLQRRRSRSQRLHGVEYSMLVQGLARISIVKTTQTSPYTKAMVQLEKDSYQIEESLKLNDQVKDLMSIVASNMNVSKKWQIPLPLEQGQNGTSSLLPLKMSAWIDMVAAHAQGMSIMEKQRLLDALNVGDRMKLLLSNLKGTPQIETENRFTSAITSPGTLVIKYRGNHRNDDDDDENDDHNAASEDLKADIAALESKLTALQPFLSTATARMVSREMKRLKHMNANQPDYHVVQQYLELFVDLPWKPSTSDEAPVDMDTVQRQLDKDHYGMQRVKARLVEFMAVRQLQETHEKKQGLILCLVGPPGVGKTSLAQSIATATQRPMERLALGGVSEESEIRGHRRTYVGAMPGNILAALRRCHCSHPLIVLDEIDKVGAKYHNHGNHASAVAHALLEVLDPHQNHAFTDHYLNAPFDLSRVLFIATANSTETIPRPLLDRIEVIHMDGYSIEEKQAIARQYLLPRQLHAHGLATPQVSNRIENTTAILAKNDKIPSHENIEWLDERTLACIISEYTSEAGVRELERQVSRSFPLFAMDTHTHIYLSMGLSDFFCESM